MQLFDAISKALVDPTEGRMIGTSLGIVTATDDPLELHRIKVTTGDKGGLTESYWVYATCYAPGVTLPPPKLGDTVILGYLDGNPHQPVYLGLLHNTVNPPAQVDGIVFDLGLEQTMTFRVGGNVMVFSKTGITINSRQVAVVGATDSRGDTLVTKGW